MEDVFTVVRQEHNALMRSPKVLGEWARNLEAIEALAFDQGGKWKSFLNQPVILQSMFMNAQGKLLQNQLEFVLRTIPMEHLELCLPEPEIGNPPVVSIGDFSVSHNTVHHLYHIARFARTKGFEVLSSSKTFVEWGGGYGNFARLIKTINPNATYTIINLPIFSLIQFRYLSEVLGEDKVTFLEKGEQPVEGTINLLPSTYWEETELAADFIVATWALSESPIEVQERVYASSFFGASHGLFGFHQCGYHIPFMKESISLHKKLEQSGYEFSDVRVVPGKNFYAFK